MPYVRIEAHDRAAIAQLTDFYNAARPVDDPDAPAAVASIVAGDLAYGWDLDPDETYFYYSGTEDEPVGVLAVDMPKRDNRNLVWAAITVHPEHRRKGHGSAMMKEVFRRAAEADRSLIWAGLAADDAGGKAFLERFGFAYANHDARRRQVLADVDRTALDRLFTEAAPHATAYRLERLSPPYSEQLLSELVDVTAAINDAPMGDLTFEDEFFDLARLKDLETARGGRGERVYRVVARHAETGEIGGHTEVLVNPARPQFGVQADTAVARTHRGHRLGLLLKIDMLRWLAEAEPQLTIIETWNQADNDYMIRVNEKLGYRINRVFDTYELNLATRHDNGTLDGVSPQM
jgi:GNAT superfamily N-acetyltransferase